MDIKTYRANSVHEALQLIRRDLGPEAIVLRTREVRAGGWLGLVTGKRCTEVIASAGSQTLGQWLRPKGPLDQGIDLSELSGTPSFPPI